MLALKPTLAVFDCDGTLWSGDAGRDFFYWEMDRGLITTEVAEAMRARYKLYETGEVGEEPMCAEMVTMNRGVAAKSSTARPKSSLTKLSAGASSPRCWS